MNKLCEMNDKVTAGSHHLFSVINSHQNRDVTEQVQI